MCLYFFAPNPKSLSSADFYIVLLLDLDLGITDECKSVLVVNNVKHFHFQYLKELK